MQIHGLKYFTFFSARSLGTEERQRRPERHGRSGEVVESGPRRIEFVGEYPMHGRVHSWKMLFDVFPHMNTCSPTLTCFLLFSPSRCIASPTEIYRYVCFIVCPRDVERRDVATDVMTDDFRSLNRQKGTVNWTPKTPNKTLVVCRPKYGGSSMAGTLFSLGSVCLDVFRLRGRCRRRRSPGRSTSAC